MKKFISLFIFLLACFTLPAQDSTKPCNALVIERMLHGQPKVQASIKTGDTIIVKTATNSMPVFGKLDTVSDSTIHIGSRSILIKEITWVSCRKKAPEKNAGLITGGVLVAGGTLLAAAGASQWPNDISSTVLLVFAGVPTFFTGVAVMIVNVYDVMHEYSINHRRRLRAGNL